MKKVLNDTDSNLAYKLCVEYGKSQAKVAAFLGVGQATISRIIRSQLQMQKNWFKKKIRLFHKLKERRD